MGVDLLLPALVAWLSAREVRLGGRVCPWKVKPGTGGEYATYKVLSNKPSYHLKGPDRIATAVVRLEIWSMDHARAWSIAGKIAGTKDDPGLAGYRGFLAESPAKVFCQVAFNDDGGDRYDPENSGHEDGWYQVNQDYRIVYETEPRE